MDRSHRSSSSSLFPKFVKFYFLTSLSLFTFKFFSSKKKSVHRVYKFINVLERGVFNPR